MCSSDLNRGYATGQDRLDKADEKYDRGVNDAASRVGDANTGDKFNYRDVPDGSVKESEYGKSVLAIDAPNGGQVGYDIPEYMEGRKVKITMLVRVDQGRARIGLADTDGKQTSFSEAGVSKLTVIPKGEEWKLGFQEVSFVTEIPVNDRAHDGTDKAHNYRSLLQVDPGSKEIGRAHV